MLSILIPIYNYPVISLVQKLSALALAENIPFEIICIDDASTSYLDENEAIAQIEGVQYIKQTPNKGRSTLRNQLGELAKYPNLLFIDTDMEIISNDYIHQYLNYINDYDLVYGGLKYSNTKVSDEKSLRWIYGVQKEALDVEKRKMTPYISVKTCNLLIKKEAFNQTKFNTNIREYGHEDTLFSIELQRKKFKVLHIENPLLHKGIEDSSVYLSKVELATKNLAFIAKNYLQENELDEIKLIYFYKNLKKMGLLGIVNFFYNLFEKTIRKNLISAKPNLIFLNLMKLNVFSVAMKEN